MRRRVGAAAGPRFAMKRHGGARKRQPQASGTGEEQNRAAHGAPTNPGYSLNAQCSAAALPERRRQDVGWNLLLGRALSICTRLVRTLFS